MLLSNLRGRIGRRRLLKVLVLSAFGTAEAAAMYGSPRQEAVAGRTAGRAPENTVTIESTARERADYEFTVSEVVEFGERADPGTVDAIDGRTASGMVAEHGIDDYLFAGEITAFSLDGPATVSVNGEEVDPGSLGDRVAVTGELLKEDSVRPIVDATVKAVRPDSREVVAATYTDEEGQYELSVPRSSDPVDVVMYQAHDTDPRSRRLSPRGTAMPEDGTEDIFAIDRVVPSEPRDLPTLSTGLAFPFDVLVEGGDNAPVAGAVVTVGTTRSVYDGDDDPKAPMVELTDTTTDGGLFRVTGSDKTGLEVTATEVTVVVEPPPGSPAFSGGAREHTLDVSATGTSNVLRVELH